MAKNHGFADGNKRTALILVYTLLERSGYELCPADDGEVIDEAAEAMILAVARGDMSFDAVAKWFSGRIRRR